MRRLYGVTIIIGYFGVALLASVGAITIAHDFATEMGSRVPPSDAVVGTVAFVASYILVCVAAWGLNKHVLENL